MNRNSFILFLILFLPLIIQAQVGINDTGANPDPSAMLDISSTDKGLLAPRMNMAEREAITSPAVGLLVYQTDDKTGFYYFDGTEWIWISGKLKATDLITSDLPSEEGCFQLVNDADLAGPRSDHYGFEIAGNYAYLPRYTRRELRILDITDPTNPEQMGELSLGGLPRDVVVSGEYAYVAVESNSSSTQGFLAVVNVSDPANPSLTGSLNFGLGTKPVTVKVSGSFAYLLDIDSNNLRVIDVSDPSNPTLAGTEAVDPLPFRMALNGNYAYVLNLSNGNLRVIDISNPSNPNTVNTVFGVGSLTSIALSGDYMFVTDASDFLFNAYDISDPVNPTLVDNLAIDDPVRVAVSGNYAYVYRYKGGTEIFIDVVDISDPNNLTLVSSFEGPERFYWALITSGNYLFAVDDLGGPSPNSFDVYQIGCQYSLGISPSTGELVASPSNNQILKLMGDTLRLTQGGAVSLSAFMDNTDAQVLSLSGNTLSLTNGGTADLSPFVNTDAQALSLSGNSLSLTNGGSADLSSFLDNTDNQTLNFSGTTLTLSIAGGNTVDLSSLEPDNLGDHVATQNLQLSGNWLSHSGANEGIFITSTGNIGVGTSNTNAPLTVGGNAELRGDNTQFRFRSYGGFGDSFIQAGGIQTNFNAPNSITSFAPANYQMDFFLPAGNNGSTTDVLTLRADGHVGIGTTSPDEELHVIGQFKYVDGNETNGYVLTSNANGVASWQTPPGDDFGNHIATQNLQLSGNWLSHDGDPEGVFVNTNGNVGVGVSSPGAKLEVGGNMRLNSDDAKLIFFSGSSTFSLRNISEIRTNVDPPNSANPLNPADRFMAFRVATNHSGGNAEVMRVRGDGRVGIGTTSPEAFVHMNFPFEGDTSGIRLSTGGNSINSLIYHEDGDLVIRKAARPNQLVLDASGRIGMGIDDPIYPLEMASGARVTGGGVWTNASDSARKYAIRNLGYGLDEVLSMRPTAYFYKSDSSASIGFIAQEIEKIVPEVVSGEEGNKGVAYGLLTSVLVRAVQEQQEIIEAQAARIEALEAEKKAQMKDFEARLQALEASITKTR
ncbi:MAG: tail fiber domain-containing protein [Bacteroidota bacterium]